MELTRKQQEGLNIAVQRFRSGEKYTVIAGYAGSGKAQPVSTIIPTPCGDKKLGDIKVGDFVYDRSGQPTKVLQIFPQGLKENYKVTFEDGRFTFCNNEHLWSYYTSKGNLNTKTLQQMIESGLKYSNRGVYKFKIPVCKAINYPQRNFKIPPYIIGAFLGDGCCKERRLTISSENNEIPHIIAELIGNCTEKRNSEKNYNWTFQLKEPEQMYSKQQNRYYTREYVQTVDFFDTYFNELCTGADEKKIPEDYIYSSIDQRIELLQGLLDTDGSITDDGQRFNIKYTSTNLKLIEDIQKIFCSLGYKQPTISIDERSDKYINNFCYNLNINIPNEDKYKFFKLSRKKAIAEKAKTIKKRKDYTKMAIINIEKMEKPEEMVCLYVDNIEHLYLTNNFIVTHNTTLAKFIISALGQEGIDIENEVCFCSFTGKAAQVLQKKGNKNCYTLHKLLYESLPKSDGTFFIRPKVDIEYKIIVVDEISMAPKSMMSLLFSHRDVYVICFGDPLQLPVLFRDEDNHLLDNPHVFLNEIMRQAQESEIIRMTMKIRDNDNSFYEEFKKGKEVQIFDKKELSTGMLTWADQVLVATNESRILLNKQIRKFYGRSEQPEEGDKMICLKNYWEVLSNKQNPIVNGTTGFLKNKFNSSIFVPRYIKIMKGNVVPIIISNFITDIGEEYNSLAMDSDLINTGENHLSSKEAYCLYKKQIQVPMEFAYGYAITTHKAQGSEWDKVLGIEERFPYSKSEHIRWLYTTCTRASQKLVLIKN